MLYATTFYPFDAILAVKLLILNLAPDDAGARHVDDRDGAPSRPKKLPCPVKQVVAADPKRLGDNRDFPLGKPAFSAFLAAQHRVCVPQFSR